MKSRRQLRRLALFFLILLTTISCSAKTQAQKELGPDADYFMGLTLLENGRQKEAIAKFTHCFKKGTYYCARASAIKLCEFGSLQEKNEACIRMLNKFNDSETLLIAAKHFLESNEINKIIEYTSKVEFTSSNNTLLRIRMEALNRRLDSDYTNEVYKWFTSVPISTEHYQFYRDTFEHPDFDSEDVEYTPQQFAINYRIELYKRNYTYTFSNAHQILTYFEDGFLTPNQQLTSDIGKSFLYGSMKFPTNGQLFREYAQKFQNTPIEYYFWFYAGRFYEKAGMYYTQTKSCFEKAIETAPSPSQKDDALWYLLDFSLKTSLSNTLSNLNTYAKQWSNGDYFDNFLETVLSSLLVSGKWDTFYDIYTAVDGYASNEIVAQYAYIYARLIQEGMIKEKEGHNLQEDMINGFTRALKADSSIYYKIMAANRLNLSQDEFMELMDQTNYLGVKPTDKAADNIIKGCVLFGFPDLIYPLWKDLGTKGISTDTAFYVSDFLNKCSTGEDDYYQQSLRIASRAASTAQRPLKKEELKLLYPENYLDFVENSCQKYGLQKSVVLALIRSESFFDPDVNSSAGAVGLTQLMELTSGDIARKLKYKEYSLEDPETNIEFGTYYLSELYRRCDGSYLQTFFSYNAGISRVRKWLKSSIVEFGLKKDMPLDLFLESLPFAETREYGRKLVSAGVMYEWLYDENQKPFQEIVNNFVK